MRVTLSSALKKTTYLAAPQCLLLHERKNIQWLLRSYRVQIHWLFHFLIQSGLVTNVRVSTQQTQKHLYNIYTTSTQRLRRWSDTV